MKCPACKTKMKIEINDKSDATLWYLCDCWYCKLIHHPVRNLLNWLDKSWHKRHKQIIKTKQPNKPEIVLTELLNNFLSNEYKYVGDGKVIIGGFNPDFININGQKKIIEMFGDYWHNRTDTITRDKIRLKTYKEYGYKTLIIWEHELKNNLKKLILKLKEFNNG